nr:hypothetical protein [Tanacetum cinerariifolium]
MDYEVAPQVAFRVFNTRGQQTKETYQITFDEIPDAIKFLNPSVDNINIAETERYPPDEYLHHYEFSQRYQSNHKESHLITVKRIFKYLKGTPSLGLWYPKCLDFDLKGYSDSDYVGCNMDMKSTSGACQLLGGKLVCWSAKKQQSVVMSSAEAEYVDADRSSQSDIPTHCKFMGVIDIELHFIPTQYQLADIFTKPLDEPTFKRLIVKLASQSDIPTRCKFMGVTDIELHFIPTQYQLADIFTKPLDEPTFKRLIVELGYNEEIGTNGTLKKSCLPPRWRLLMGQIIQCLGGKICGLDEISNKDAIILYCLANRVQVDYAKLIWEDLIHKLDKKTREKIVPYPRFLSLLLEHMIHEYENEELTINLTQAICNLDVLVDSKAPKPSSQTEEVPQGKNPRAKSGFKRKRSSKHISDSTTKASISQTGQSKKETKSSSAKDKSPNHPSPPIPVVDYAKLIWEDLIHKLDKKTREKIVPYPRFLSLLLEHMIHEYENEELTINLTQAICNLDVLVDSKAPKPSSQTEEVPQGKNPRAKSGFKRKRSSKHISDSTTKASISQTGQSKKETKSSSANDKSPNHPSPPTPVVGEIHTKAHQAAGGPTSLGTPIDSTAEVDPGIWSNPNVLIDKTKSAKDRLKTAHADSASHVFASCLPTELKELPSKITGLSREIKELKKHVRDMEIELPRDLKEIPTKLETFTSTISSLSSQLAELKNIYWELLAEFLNLPSKVSSVQEKLKILDSIPSLLHKVTDILNMFATMVENASRSTSINVPSPGKATASPANGEKNTKDTDTNLKDELVDLLDKNDVTQYYTKKLFFDKYYDKMLKRKKSPKITTCEVLTKKGPITLKIYKEDGSDEVISNLKKVYKVGKRLLYVKRNKAISLGNVTSKVGIKVHQLSFKGLYLVVTVMSSSPHSTIVPSDSDTENTFSSMNILNYFSASPRSISPDSSNNFTKYLLDILFFLTLHDDSKMELIQAYDTIPPPQVVIALPAILPPSLVLSLSPMFDSQYLFPSKKISPKDTETHVESPIPVPPSSSEGSSSPVRSTTPDYPFNKLSKWSRLMVTILYDQSGAAEV